MKYKHITLVCILTAVLSMLICLPVSAAERLHFVDVFGQEYTTEVQAGVPRAKYDLSCFTAEDGRMRYEDDTYTSVIGVDVSKYQGTVDWEKVKASGVEFAMIRLGYRGYKAGTLSMDKNFRKNLEGAAAAGLKVGVYFFSQAVNEQEAAEEAEYVLRAVEGYDLQMPVVYDPESILDRKARTDNVSGEQFTKNTVAFCNRISEAGYEPMVYANMLWEAFQFDMTQLTEVPFWYADYETLPQTPYDYRMWQYTCEGRVPGIKGNVDLNIWITKKEP